MSLGRLLTAFASICCCALFLSCSSKKSNPVDPGTPPVCSVRNLSSINFGSVATDSTIDVNFFVKNVGGGTLTGTVTEPCADFGMVGAASYSLGAGDSAQMIVRFAPQSLGAKRCTLSVGPGCSEIVCTGTGLSASPVCNVETPLLEFGTINQGTGQIRRLSIQNTGGGNLAGTITGVQGAFRLLGSPSFSLGPLQYFNLDVEFRPLCGGVQGCTLTVSPSGCAPIVCRGQGLLPTSGSCAVRVISGDVVDFGQVVVGQTAVASIQVRNTSSTYPSVGQVVDSSTEFEANFGISLLASTTVTRTVSFTPTSVGAKCYAVEIGCRMDGEGTNPGTNQWLTLRGVGVAP